ncbi:hypothetical protein Desaci_0333 [Desulfosporosinus acidiphilus SJ4]|uniref:Uncharacterized protein n=1 Tax=Desulfosporosinus acidiphilus (strain DSM 22704 / JCM 16185 / SJ4) TaxID=646529 RepID=I4D0T1_DESAJ|nr:hypothetical protein [Desulfosporosinus acidiphilus]AFM39405.1 hypothetical protein Desaci_0333 [Desulfosporosinus acidiphilus SJ4]
MILHSCKELSQLSLEIDRLWVPELCGTSDNVKFSAIKGTALDILGDLYGESSREFRVVKLTNSPATIAKVVNHIIQRNCQNSLRTDVVNL